MATAVHGFNLTKEYNVGGERVRALNDVSLEVHPGEMVGVVGRSGAGKSTLLHVLGCFQRPDLGQVRIVGQEMTQLGEAQLVQVRADKIGFVFQAFNFLPTATLLENVEISLQAIGIAPQLSRRKATAALELVGLANYLENTPSQLPARGRQYLSIARALVNDPEVIFADEPTRPLDTTSKEEFMGLLQRLNDEGRTIIISTPETSVANYCRRVVRMAEGRTVSDELVSDRRIVASSRLSEAALDSGLAELQTACPRCNNGNPKDGERCLRCNFILHLTKEDEDSIKGRLSGTQGRWLGVVRWTPKFGQVAKRESRS